MSRAAPDPLDVLRRGWASVAPGEPPDEPADEATRAVRDELRRAWRTLEPSTDELPWRLRRRTARQAAAWPAAVAAAALVALGAVLWRAGGAPAPPDGSARGPAPGPRIVSVTADRLELSSGNVRFVLLTENTTSVPEVDDRKEPR